MNKKFKDFVRRVTRSAVAQGLIQKTPCVKCKNIEVVAHHKDYQKPFDVIWLCKDCHHELHASITVWSKRSENEWTRVADVLEF